MFSHKELLAVLIRESIDLFRGMSTEEMVSCIKAPANDVYVSQGMVRLEGTESSAEGEAITKFDMLVDVEVPPERRSSANFVKVKVNCEMNRNDNSGYTLTYSLKRSSMPVERELLDRLDSVMDMVTVKYLFIDKRIFTTKLVNDMTWFEREMLLERKQAREYMKQAETLML